MTTEKIVNYTTEQTAHVLAEYAAGMSVEAIALQMGKSVRSVIAKLSREKVYTSPTAAARASRVTKADLIAAIAVKFNVEPEALESLEKATRPALEVLAGLREA